MPTADAIQCVDVTTPNVPLISGRVVKFTMAFVPRCMLVLGEGFTHHCVVHELDEMREIENGEVDGFLDRRCIGGQQ
jgi:hypothetical protein